MSRRRWLVAYDICDDARLRRVHDVVRSHGERLQYSVFLCDLNDVERISLLGDLRDVIDHRRDSVVFIDLGEPGRSNSARIEFMGTVPPLPSDGATII